jgi:hypothetical protein
MNTPIEAKRGWVSRLAGLVGFLLWRSPVLLLMVAVPCVAVWIMIKPVPGAALKTLDSPAVAVTAAKAEDTKETLGIDFTKLSFVPAKDPLDAKTGQPRYADQLPENIKGYDGRKVRIRGFLLPVKMEGNEVREFLIVANQMSCCFGTTPQFWEFVAAKAVGDAVPNLMDRPLTFEGVLKVGDVYESGYWTQLYTLECTAVGK